MANKEKGQCSAVIGGTTYILQYSTNAMVELEDATGKGAMELIGEMRPNETGEVDPDKIKLKTVRALFWAALIDKQPEITLQQAGELMDKAGLQTIGPLIGDAFTLAFPEDAGKAESNGSSVGKRKAA